MVDRCEFLFAVILHAFIDIEDVLSTDELDRSVSEDTHFTHMVANFFLLLLLLLRFLRRKVVHRVVAVSDGYTSGVEGLLRVEG